MSKKSAALAHDDRAHAALSFSSAERWLNCPGSFSLTQQVPKSLPTEASKLGTKAHELCERAVTAFLEKKLTGKGDDALAKEICDMEDQKLAESAIGYVDFIWEKVLDQSITDKFYGLEEKFILSESLDIWGTSDFWAMWTDNKGKVCLAVVDYKNGYNEVAIEKNPQIAGYIVAICEDFLKNGVEIDCAFGYIYQPNSPKPEKEVKYTAKQIAAWRDKFIKAGTKIMVDGNQDIKPGAHCKWCPAQSKCPKYLPDLRDQKLDGLLTSDKGFPTLETLPDEQLVKIITHRKQMEQFLKSASQYALTRFAEGKPIAGLKVVEAASRRGWIDDELIVEENLKRLGVKEIFENKLKGIGKIETQLRDLGHSKKKAAELLEDCVRKPPGAKSIVSEDDPREAVKNLDDLLTDLNTIEDEE